MNLRERERHKKNNCERLEGECYVDDREFGADSIFLSYPTYSLLFAENDLGGEGSMGRGTVFDEDNMRDQN